MVTLLIGPTVGVIAAGLSCSFLLLFSWLAALRYRPPDRRNLLAGATQMASYLSGYVVVWSLLAMLAAIGAFLGKPWFKDVSRMLRISRELLQFGAWLFLNLVYPGGYILLVFGGTSSLRYANR